MGSLVLDACHDSSYRCVDVLTLLKNMYVQGMSSTRSLPRLRIIWALEIYLQVILKYMVIFKSIYTVFHNYSESERRPFACLDFVCSESSLKMLAGEEQKCGWEEQSFLQEDAAKVSDESALVVKPKCNHCNSCDVWYPWTFLNIWEYNFWYPWSFLNIFEHF